MKPGESKWDEKRWAKKPSPRFEHSGDRPGGASGEQVVTGDAGEINGWLFLPVIVES